MTVDPWRSAVELPDAPAWLQAMRRSAFARYQEIGWAHDEYRHTDLKPLKAGMELADPGETDLEAIRPFLPKTETARLVFVDGRHSPRLSQTSGLPGGVIMRRIGDCLDDLQGHFGPIASSGDGMACLNAATWQDGAFVHVPADEAVPGVLHVVFVQTGQSGLRPIHNVFRVDEGADATIMESHVHLADDAGMTFAATHIEAGPATRVRHVKVQKEDRRARHIAMERIVQRRDSTVQSVLLDVGGVQARQSMHALLQEKGADCDLQGVFFGQRQQRTDVWTRIDHSVPDCTSHERFKGIMDDESRGAFTGLIVVHPGAHGTGSEQENRNLLLSDRSHVDSTPQLEIHNDDVRCSHGSTIGQLDEDQLFFLRTRGIGMDAARMMLTRAFASEVIQAVADAGIRELLDKYLHVWFIKHQEHLR